MALPFEAQGQLTSFDNGVVIRKAQLESLSRSLEQGLNIVTDTDRVNDMLAVSVRPDLIMTEPVPQLQITWPYKSSDICNFSPGMQGFGPRVYKNEKSWRTGEIEPTFVGRRPANPMEKEVYRLLAGRRDNNDSSNFAYTQGIDPDITHDIYSQSLARHEAFARMYTLLPKLTEILMDWCIDDRYKHGQRDIKPEIYVGYCLMSRLVDRTDTYAVKTDGSMDGWRLCH